MKPLIVANWKMNPQNLTEAQLLFNSIKKGIKNTCLEQGRRAVVVICPPFIYLPCFVEFLYRCRKSQLLALGGQDLFYEEKGAFTGEISPLMLKNLGCQYVIIGHSERRKLGETDEMINKKIKAAIKAGLKPILCVGEKKKESKEDREEIYLHLKENLLGIKKSDLENLIITYEPIWAISTTQGGVAAAPRDAKEGANLIRKFLAKLLGKNLTQKIKILYGGSVDSKNVNSFIYEAETEGVLIGAASLNSKEFIEIVKKVSSKG